MSRSVYTTDITENMLHSNKSLSFSSTCGTLLQTHTKAYTSDPTVTASIAVADWSYDFTYCIYFAINATASIAIVDWSYGFTYYICFAITIANALAITSPYHWRLRNGWSIC